METSILRAAITEIRSSLSLPARIMAIERLDETAIALQLDDGERRARLVLDVHPASATFHVSNARKDLVSSDSGLPRLLEGAVVIRLDEATEERSARLHLRMPDPAFLVAEWIGRSGNARVVSGSGEVLATLRAGGPGPGDVYADPRPDRRPDLSKIDAPTLADALKGAVVAEWPLVLKKMVRDLDPLHAFDAISVAVSAMASREAELTEQVKEFGDSVASLWADAVAQRIVDNAQRYRSSAPNESIRGPMQETAPKEEERTQDASEHVRDEEDPANYAPTTGTGRDDRHGAATDRSDRHGADTGRNDRHGADAARNDRHGDDTAAKPGGDSRDRANLALHYYSFPPTARLALPGHREAAATTYGFPAAWVSSHELRSLSSFRQEADEPLLQLLARAHHANRNARSTAERRAEIRQRTTSEQRRLLRLRQTLSAELGDSKDGQLWRRYAEAILTNLRAIPKGASVFVCPDLSHPDAEKLEIPLDPAKPAKDAADEYFKRARRWDRGRPVRLKRIQKLDEAITQLSLLESRIADSDPPPGWESFETNLRTALRTFYRAAPAPETRRDAPSMDRAEPGASTRSGSSAKGQTGAPTRSASRSDREATRNTAGSGERGSEPRSRRPPDPRDRFRPREFQIRDGWMVIVGRTNQENDYVTHSIARQDDLWFHASGVPGSHVVLKKAGRKDNPSAKAIEEAAAIAAYYSKARHSKKAPVIYTLKKYVSKPRKGKAGLAQCTREKSVLVLPWSPVEDQTPEWMED